MAIGKPILMFQNGDAARLIQEARCGLVGEPENIEQIVKMTVSFLELKKENRDIMARNAKQYYLSNLAMAVGVSGLAKLLYK